jgi:hypothetical protein
MGICQELYCTKRTMQQGKRQLREGWIEVSLKFELGLTFEKAVSKGSQYFSVGTLYIHNKFMTSDTSLSITTEYKLCDEC